MRVWIMDEFTSQKKKTVQMERNESEECCMAGKNQNVRDIVESKYVAKFDPISILQRILLVFLKEKKEYLNFFLLTYLADHLFQEMVFYFITSELHRSQTK